MISVIVPIYNLSSYCGRGIEAILRQTYSDFELILVNDGSTDNSLDVCRNYAAKDSRIRVVTQENQGVSVARNTGIKEAKGEYVAFIDGDDIVSEDYLKILRKHAGDGVCWVVGGHQRIYENSDFVREQSEEYSKLDCSIALKRLLQGRFPVCVCGGIFVTEKIKDLQFPVGYRNNEDKFFLFQYFLRNQAEKVKVLSGKFYGYFVRCDSATTASWNGRDDVVRLADMMVEECKANCQDFLEESKLNAISTRFQLLKTIVRSKRKDDLARETIARLRKEILESGLSKNFSFQTKVEFYALKLGVSPYRMLVWIFYTFTSEAMRFHRNEKVIKQ